MQNECPHELSLTFAIQRHAADSANDSSFMLEQLSEVDTLHLATTTNKHQHPNPPLPFPTLLSDLPAATISESKEIDALLTWLTTDEPNAGSRQGNVSLCPKTALPAALCQCTNCISLLLQT
jgi:hypothetical protein